MKKVRVLSLDGGGIRGIIPATIVAYIEKRFIEITQNPNARIADLFDIIVGTSTGGILSCFYLTPNPIQSKNSISSKYTAAEALEFYSEKGFSIFNASKRNKWLGIRQFFNATQYSPKNLENIFQEEFGDLKMSELLKLCLVTTYDLNNKTPFFFSSKEPQDKKREFYVRDVVRSTSAAPTYFPPAMIKNLAENKKLNKMINIDGGVFANNPTLCAYTECRNSVFPQKKYPSAKDMLILSIGTGGGRFKLPDVKKSAKWSVINWAKSIPEIMMDGSIDTVEHHMKDIFGSLGEGHRFNYKRIDVPLDKRKYANDMADASKQNIEALKTAANEALKQALRGNNNEYGLDYFLKLLIKNTPEPETI